MSQIEAKVIEDSTSGRTRLTTLQLRYPRFVHAEFMTHRVFSRNASSSRAIPVAKMIEQVRTNPAVPVHWGANQPGMQAREEVGDIENAKYLWRLAASQAADTAEKMMELGLHKQVANRILEPFQFIHVIVTATEWDNFFQLRDHPDADPNIHALARVMKSAMEDSTPAFRSSVSAKEVSSSWHLPYVTGAERLSHFSNPQLLAKLSAARCARVSYLTHSGELPDSQKDLALYERLVGSVPLHASPVEHQGYPILSGGMAATGNFDGWVQFRKMVELGVA